MLPWAVFVFGLGYCWTDSSFIIDHELGENYQFGKSRDVRLLSLACGCVPEV